MQPPKLRNPGLYSFLIFVSMVLFVAFLYWMKAPEATRLGGSLFGLAIAAFGAKSALEQRGRVVKETSYTIGGKEVASVAREKPQTWPGKKGGPQTLEVAEVADAYAKSTELPAVAASESTQQPEPSPPSGVTLGQPRNPFKDGDS